MKTNYLLKLRSFVLAFLTVNLLSLPLTIIQSLANEGLIVLPDSGRDPFLKAIGSAQKTLKICAYAFSDPEIVQPVLEAAKRDVQVDLIIEPQRQEHARSDNAQSVNPYNFKHPNIHFHSHKDKDHQLHQKFLIVDGTDAYMQTNNFDAESFDGTVTKQPNDPSTRDFALSIKNSELIKQLNDRFDALANHKVQPSISNQNNDRQDYLVFGPGSQRDDLQNLVAQATKSIDTYQQNFYDVGIVDAFKAALDKGLNVRIIMMKNPHGKDDKNKEHQEDLIKAGATIHYMTKYYQHTKVIIVDGDNSDTQQMYMGSCNLFPKSIDEHYEAGIVSFDPKVIKRTRQVFEADFAESEPADFLTEKK